MGGLYEFHTPWCRLLPSYLYHWSCQHQQFLIDTASRLCQIISSYKEKKIWLTRRCMSICHEYIYIYTYNIHIYIHTYLNMSMWRGTCPVQLCWLIWMVQLFLVDHSMLWQCSSHRTPGSGAPAASGQALNASPIELVESKWSCGIASMTCAEAQLSERTLPALVYTWCEQHAMAPWRSWIQDDTRRYKTIQGDTRQ